MTRLDTVIKRLMAQRSCINAAAGALQGFQGHILELGLGNGRTYDHLRFLFPDRDIYVFDREVASHPNCRPDAAHLFLGPMDETLLKAADRLGPNGALVHADIGFGDSAATERNVVALGPKIPAQSLDRFEGLAPMPLPADVEVGRYHVYCRS
jgi:hypothetical protein